MNLNNTKKLMSILLGLSVAICIGGLFFEKGSQQMQYSAVAALVCIALAIGVGLKWARCPWCGKLLIRGFYSKKVCPACRRDLETGKKKKGKGGKR